MGIAGVEFLERVAGEGNFEILFFSFLETEENRFKTGKKGESKNDCSHKVPKKPKRNRLHIIFYHPL
jgi:hypothetical protein